MCQYNKFFAVLDLSLFFLQIFSLSNNKFIRTVYFNRIFLSAINQSVIRLLAPYKSTITVNSDKVTYNIKIFITNVIHSTGLGSHVFNELILHMLFGYHSSLLRKGETTQIQAYN